MGAEDLKKTKKKSKDPPMRFRFTVPAHDLDVLEFLNAQENLSLSLRMIVQDYMNKFGPMDAVYNGVGRVQALYGSKPKVKAAQKDMGYVSVEKRTRNRAEGAADEGRRVADRVSSKEAARQAPAVPHTTAAALPVSPPVANVLLTDDDNFDPMEGIELPDYSQGRGRVSDAERLINEIL